MSPATGVGPGAACFVFSYFRAFVMNFKAGRVVIRKVATRRESESPGPYGPCRIRDHESTKVRKHESGKSERRGGEIAAGGISPFLEPIAAPRDGRPCRSEGYLRRVSSLQSERIGEPFNSPVSQP